MKMPPYFRVLGIAPCYRGFGFAVLDSEALIDWGAKTVNGEKNTCFLSKVEPLMVHYKPDLLALENFAISRRGLRVRLLIQDTIVLAQKYVVGVKLISREELYDTFFSDGKGTKEDLAAVLAERFPDELGMRLPPKRRLWSSEDFRMCIFDALAFGLAAIGKEKRFPDRLPVPILVD